MKQFLILFLISSIFIHSVHAEVPCDYERVKYNVAKENCDTGKTTTDYIAGGCVAAALIVITCGGSLFHSLIGLGGGVPAGITHGLCQLKDRREKALRECEAHEAWRESVKQEARRVAWIEDETKRVAKVAAKLYMNKLDELKVKMEQEVIDLYDRATEEGRFSNDPDRPTPAEVFEEIAREEAAIRAKYF